MKHFYFIILLFSFSLSQKAQVTMVTNMPPSIAPNANLNIEVKINKGTIGNFSKYEIDLPQGFEANEGNSQAGYFTFEKGRVKIVWVTIPAEAEFIISFKLKTPATTGPNIFYHKFLYMENGTKKEVLGQQIDVKVETSGVTKTLSYLPEPEAPTISSNTVPITITTVATPTIISTTTVLTTGTASITSKENTIISNTTNSIATVPVITSSNALITSQNDIIYLVQIGTFGADPGKAKYSDLGKVTIEKAGAVYKVLIGDFNTKEEALKKREELVTKGYNGFLVKYQGGQRAQ